MTTLWPARSSLPTYDDRAFALADAAVWPVQLIASLDEHLDLAAEPSRGLARRDLPLQRQQVVESSQLLLVRHVVVHPGRRERPRARRVHRDVDDVELHLLDQRAGVEIGHF